ncbi:MAG: OmpA family protein [Verrucomicrobiales bacterium]|nr:OmpA family protein [Verrucomicrobiales bacterium]
MSSGYAWEEPEQTAYYDDTEARSLRWWTLVAVVMSIFVHVLLFFLFKLWDVNRSSAPMKDVVLARPMNVNRVSIDPSLLEEPTLPEGTDDLPPEVTQVAETFRSDDVDPLEIEDPSIQDIIATPQVEMIENLAAGPGPDAEVEDGKLDEVVEQLNKVSEAAMTKELDAVREQLMRFKPVSENQLVMPISAGESLADDPSDVLKEMAEAQGAVIASGEGVPEGYASLDELLSYNGPAVDLNKPVMMPTDLLYGYNEVSLRETAKLSLMKLGFLIQKNPDALFIVEGHTDSFGSSDYNQRLSERRAAAVVEWLVESLKLDPAQMDIRGYGELRPITDPSGTIEEQGLNRRVEIVIKRSRPGAAE